MPIVSPSPGNASGLEQTLNRVTFALVKAITETLPIVSTCTAGLVLGVTE